ncbi:hypothetical protein MJO29_005511 [Puccinia striiformis f. sp. tritici]|uniref:Toprim domain-containing protein n=2 Tax=Puccinia striiformis TaxID=27350 RepID=A0A2S4WMN2_9BASI|nr:hypothetical protein MJO29_005511 [Puccinia striiformis f. sp. tritici]POV94989.1 hypothetical protein PSTT_16534 [Puccinia striiformis]POW22957.1 hypothetical protein PSHT_00753 [Puccinia striiformis]
MKSKGQQYLGTLELCALLARDPTVTSKSIPIYMLMDGDLGGSKIAKSLKFGYHSQAYLVDTNTPQAKLI